MKCFIKTMSFFIALLGFSNVSIADYVDFKSRRDKSPPTMKYLGEIGGVNVKGFDNPTFKLYSFCINGLRYLIMNYSNRSGITPEYHIDKDDVTNIRRCNN